MSKASVNSISLVYNNWRRVFAKLKWIVFLMYFLCAFLVCIQLQPVAEASVFTTDLQRHTCISKFPLSFFTQLLFIFSLIYLKLDLSSSFTPNYSYSYSWCFLSIIPVNETFMHLVEKLDVSFNISSLWLPSNRTSCLVNIYYVVWMHLLLPVVSATTFIKAKASGLLHVPTSTLFSSQEKEWPVWLHCIMSFILRDILSKSLMWSLSFQQEQPPSDLSGLTITFFFAAFRFSVSPPVWVPSAHLGFPLALWLGLPWRPLRG